MFDTRYRTEMEILSVTDTDRRKRWTVAENVRIVKETFGGHGRVAETARRHDVGRILLVRWRRRYREGQLMRGGARPQFTPLTSLPDQARVHMLGERRWKISTRFETQTMLQIRYSKILYKPFLFNWLQG